MSTTNQRIKPKDNKMTYYDDNFGFYEIRDEDDIEFYHKMQARNEEKICVVCGRTVRINPNYEVCNSCADRRESGWAY